MRRTALVLRPTLAVLSLVCATGALPVWAEEDDDRTPASPVRVPELASVRLRYGAALRSGGQTDTGPGLSYDGLTANDLALFATVFGDHVFGAWVNAQREGFSLFDGDTRITGGGLLRASVGPAVRGSLGRVRGELSVGYAYAQLAAFENTATPTLQTGTRQAALVSARVLVPLFLGVRAEVRGEVPIAFSVTDSTGGDAKSSGFSAGAAVLVPLHTPGAWSTNALVDYHYVDDTLTNGAGLRSTQQLHRFGLGLEVAYLGEAGRRGQGPTRGEVAFTVVDASTREPLPDAVVSVIHTDGTVSERDVDAQGLASAADLAPGTVRLEAKAAGHRTTTGTARIVAGERAVVELALPSATPQTGDLSLQLRSAEGGVPLPGATVEFRGVTLTSSDQGRLVVRELKPGRFALKVRKEGFKPLDETVEVIVGAVAEVSLTVSPVARRIPATLSGQVRNARGGRPVAATLEIPEAKVRGTTNARGTFSVHVPGGTYQVIISAEGFRTQKKSVTVKDGDQAIFNVDLSPSAH